MNKIAEREGDPRTSHFTSDLKHERKREPFTWNLLILNFYVCTTNAWFLNFLQSCKLQTCSLVETSRQLDILFCSVKFFDFSFRIQAVFSFRNISAWKGSNQFRLDWTTWNAVNAFSPWFSIINQHLTIPADSWIKIKRCFLDFQLNSISIPRQGWNGTLNLKYWTVSDLVHFCLSSLTPCRHEHLFFFIRATLKYIWTWIYHLQRSSKPSPCSNNLSE